MNVLLNFALYNLKGLYRTMGYTEKNWDGWLGSSIQALTKVQLKRELKRVD